MDSVLDLLQNSIANLSQLPSLILLAVGLIYVVKASLRKRFRLPPGPSGWPLIGGLPLLGNMPHHSLYQLSKQYGPIMYMKLGTTDTVVVSSPKMAEACLKTNDLNFSSRSGNSAAKYIGYDSNGLVWGPYGPHWRMLRKVCNIHLFAGKALEDLQPPVREAEVGMLLKSILEHERQGKAVNLGELLNICTANVLGQIMLSKRVFDSQGAKASEFREMVVEQMKLSGMFIIGDYVPSLAWMDLQGVKTKMKKLHNRFDEFFTKMIKEHQTASVDAGRDNFLSVLWALRNDADGKGGRLTETDIKGLLLTLFAVGTDTSASTVEWAMAELIRNPQMMKRCQEEIDSAVKGEQRTLKESDLQNLPYLQAVVKEILRLHPSVPLLVPRTAAEACEIEGYYIPKNARLLVNAWGMQRDPDLWERPLEFDPDRFVGNSVDMRGADFQFIPFGAGRRICAGMNMGIRMVQLMLASLLHSFDFSLPSDQPPEMLDMAEAVGITVHKAVPLLVVPSARYPLD